MNIKIIPTYLLLLLFFSTDLYAKPPLPRLVLQSEVVTSSIRSLGMGATGLAIPGDIASITINPAMMHTMMYESNIGITANISYAKDDIFSKHIFNAGFGIHAGIPYSFGILYRDLKANDNSWQKEAILNISRTLFNENIAHGIVNLGINVRYQNSSWVLNYADTVLVPQKKDSLTKYELPIPATDYTTKEKRLILDIGLFQMNIGEGVDFGISINNIVGYVWNSTNSYLDTSHIVLKYDTLANDSIVEINWKDTVTVNSETIQSKDFLNNYCKNIKIGIAFHKNLLQDRVFINLPFDFEILGLLDHNQKMLFIFNTGLETWIKGQYCIRFGYSKTPLYYPQDLSKIKKENVFSGGLGIRIKNLGIDLYTRRKTLGISIGLLL